MKTSDLGKPFLRFAVYDFLEALLTFLFIKRQGEAKRLLSPVFKEKAKGFFRPKRREEDREIISAQYPQGPFLFDLGLKPYTSSWIDILAEHKTLARTIITES